MSFLHNNVLSFDQELFNPDTVDILGLDPIGELSFELPTSNPPAGFQPQADITAQTPAIQQQPVDPNLLKQVYAQLLTPYIERHVQTLLQNTSLNQQIISQVVQQPQARPTSSPHLPPQSQRPPLPQAAAPIPTIEQLPQTPQQPIQLTISPAAIRESKLQKYRLKRQKRNFNRPVDQDKSRVANARPRDANGHFLPGKISRRVTSGKCGKIIYFFSYHVYSFPFCKLMILMPRIYPRESGVV